MGFHFYRGLVRPPPAIHAVPHYQDDSCRVTLHTDCPFTSEELPPTGSADPPPLMEGQEMRATHRDDWGRPLNRVSAVAVRVGGRLKWHCLDWYVFPQSRWNKTVLFPG